MNELKQFRKNASLKSIGKSSDLILQAILNELKILDLQNIHSILDIGCGTGDLLKSLKTIYPYAKLSGVDYTDFSNLGNDGINFYQHDCNQNFPTSLTNYDLIISSEVIEHLENGRHFIREILKMLNWNGTLILSTPNPESITSILSYICRGYHSAFGPNDYPAHINSYTLFELSNILMETKKIQNLSHKYIRNGRIPHSKRLWNDLFPCFNGKRFSDNYIVIAQNFLPITSSKTHIPR
ncbi:MAG: hypothetical protein A2202_01110 [Bdellovibrionales bacterium RIFOXYA1_FULL_36_14]|nr:MAG: hypothetical protein A2202_01110 [Bdellovibrionales bacterium RIFOXYA1_FULL_36_14]